jgi:hypothetical protein
MSGSNEGPAKGPAKPGADAGASKKPSALIDLKATEVKSSESKPEAKPAAGSTSSGTTETGDKASVNPQAGAAKPATAGTSSAPPGAKPGASSSPSKPSTPVAPERQKSFGGGLAAVATHLFAGVAGGFLALLGADTIAPQLGLTGPATSMSEMQKRLAAVEETAKAKNASAASDVAQKLAAAEGRVAKLEELGRTLPAVTDAQAKLAAETKSLAEKMSQPAPGADAERLAKLEEALSALSAAAATDPQKGRIPQLAAITGKLADLEATLNGQMATVRKNVTQDVEARLGQATEAAEQSRAGVQRIDRDLSAVKTDAARASQRLDAIDQTVRSVNDEVASLKGEIAGQLKNVARSQDVSSALTPLTTKLSAIEQNIAGVVKSEDDRRATAERIVLSLELANLKRAIDRGGPYAAELAAVQKAGGSKLDLKALEPFKDKGIASTTALSADFRSVAYSLISADVEPADGSVVDKLISGAKSIVRVRKSNADANETSAEAIAARMDAALKANRLGEVIDEAKKLSPKARTAGAAWLAKVESRAAVDKAVSDVETQLKAALASKPAP